MKNVNRPKILLFIIILPLLGSACGRFRGLGEPIATQPSVAEYFGPTSTPLPLRDLQDSCLLGDWEVDIQSFERFISLELDREGDITFNTLNLDGEIYWSFSEEILQIRTTKTIKLSGEVQFGIDATMDAMEVFYNLEGNVNWFAADGIMIFYGPNYNYPGNGNIYLGTMMSVSNGDPVGISPGVFILPAKESDLDIQWAAQGLEGVKAKGVTGYECTGDRIFIPFGEEDSLTLYKR